MADPQRTPRTIEQSGLQGSDVGNGGPGGQDWGVQEQASDALHDGAEAGLLYGAESPTAAVLGGPPARLGGYRPSNEQDQLPPPGSTEGCQTAPTGRRK